jgi:dipeptide transport system permease protein
MTTTSNIAAMVIAPPTPAAELWRDFRRNRGAVAGLSVVVMLVLFAVLANVIAPYSPSEQFRDATLAPPSLTPIGGHVFLLGTDEVGRDILSRLIHGTRLSLFIGLVSVGLSLGGGVLLGLVAGFHRGRAAEFAVMRSMDVLLALPSLLLAVAVVAVLGPGLVNAMYAIAFVMLPHFVRLTRGAVLGELAKDYVAASRVAGASTARLMFDTVLPNCAAPLIVQATLGLGAQPPTPEWGSMLASALEFIQSAWWVVTLPGLAILVTVLAFNLTGDGLRDALDPKLKT